MQKHSTPHVVRSFALPRELHAILAITARVETSIRARRVTQTEILIRALNAHLKTRGD